MGLDQLAAELPAGARRLRQDFPRDGDGMSPDQNRGGKDEGDEQPSADETQEHELGDEFTEDDHAVDEEQDDEHLEAEEPDDEEPDDEDLEEGEKDDLDEDDEELEHVVSAET